MTAPVAPPPSQFQADLISCALILLTAAGVAMAFVLTQQHEPIPGYLDAMIVGGLTSLGFYKAANPQQQAQVAQVAQQVEQLGTAVDLNHLDTMEHLATPAAAPVSTGPVVLAHGETLVHAGTGQVLWPAEPPESDAEPPEQPHMNAGMAIATAPMQPADLPPMAPSDRPAGWEPDPVLEQLHQEAAAAAPVAPAPNPLAPPLAS